MIKVIGGFVISIVGGFFRLLGEIVDEILEIESGRSAGDDVKLKLDAGNADHNVYNMFDQPHDDPDKYY